MYVHLYKYNVMSVFNNANQPAREILKSHHNIITEMDAQHRP